MAQMLSDIPPGRLVLGVVMVTLVTVPLDVLIGTTVLQQAGTVRYVGVADGTITSSQIVSVPTNKKPITVLQVRYAYEAGGREYEGDRISYSLSHDGPELAPRFAKGARVPVFYRPLRPQEAVLLRGIQGETLLALLILFCLVLMQSLGWSVLARAFRRRRDKLGVYPFKGRLHVPLSLKDLGAWLGVGLAAGGAGTLIGVGVERPSVGLMTGVWAGLLVLCGWARAWQRRHQEAGTYELVLDERRERLLVPAMYGRAEQLELPLCRIHALCLEQDFMQTREGPMPFWRPVLKFSTHPGLDERVVLAQWSEEDRAIALANWLHQRAGLRTELNGMTLQR